MSDLDELEPTLFGTRDGLGPVGDPLGRCYTPQTLADAVVDAISLDPTWSGRLISTAFPRVVEPSVGGGSFARSVLRRWPSARLLGVDVDPSAEGLALCRRHVIGDWVQVARYWDRLDLARDEDYGDTDLIVGNPPFGRAVGIDVTIAHVHACLDRAPLVVLVLPLPYMCGSEFDVIWRRQRPAVVHRVRARPWPTRLREVAVFEWRRGWRGATIVVDLAGYP